jgi:Ca2+-binding EF-hand superfamily protein
MTFRPRIRAVAGLAAIATLAIGACALVVAMTASRAHAADQGQPTFDALDKDKDGVITASEARAHPAIASRFAEADKNQDGYLSRAEFNSIGRP